jgi:hypothetical protein
MKSSLPSKAASVSKGKLKKREIKSNSKYLIKNRQKKDLKDPWILEVLIAAVNYYYGLFLGFFLCGLFL